MYKNFSRLQKLYLYRNCKIDMLFIILLIYVKIKKLTKFMSAVIDTLKIGENSIGITSLSILNFWNINIDFINQSPTFLVSRFILSEISKYSVLKLFNTCCKSFDGPGISCSLIIFFFKLRTEKKLFLYYTHIGNTLLWIVFCFSGVINWSFSLLLGCRTGLIKKSD